MRLVAALLLIGSAGILRGCAGLPKSCEGFLPSSAGTSLVSKAVAVVKQPRSLADEPMVRLQCLADLHQMDAAVELGRRYEEGVDVAADPARAAALYRRAATPVPPMTAIYSPPVRRGGNGQMLFLNNPNASAGSAEAQFRLGRLYLDGRGVERDSDAGWRLIRAAIKQGYGDAIIFSVMPDRATTSDGDKAKRERRPPFNMKAWPLIGASGQKL